MDRRFSSGDNRLLDMAHFRNPKTGDRQKLKEKRQAEGDRHELPGVKYSGGG